MADGWDDVLRMVNDAADAALRVEGEVALNRTRDLVPRATDELYNSLAIEDDGTEVHLATDAEHAVYQHEALEIQHPTGQAKFMEAAVTGRSNFDAFAKAAARAAAQQFG